VVRVGGYDCVCVCLREAVACWVDCHFGVKDLDLPVSRSQRDFFTDFVIFSTRW